MQWVCECSWGPLGSLCAVKVAARAVEAAADAVEAAACAVRDDSGVRVNAFLKIMVCVVFKKLWRFKSCWNDRATDRHGFSLTFF